LFIVAGWLTAVGIGTGCFASSGTRAATDEVIAFACSFAVAVPIASAMPLILGGKTSRAVEPMLAIALAIVASGGMIYVFLWAAPSLVRSRMGYWEFLRLQHLVLFAASMSASLCAPLGAIVGGAIGTIAGLLVLLARRTPKLTAGLVAGLLLACASGPVQSFAFGRATDLVLEWRLEGGKWAVSSISQNEIASALGATIGAVLGAVIASAVMHVRRGSILNVRRCPSLRESMQQTWPVESAVNGHS
jgi:hypothetical protein